MKRRSAAERFWPKVEVLGPDECWLWTSATKGVPGKEYGNFWLGLRGRLYIGAHVFSWEIAHGTLPPGMWVLHRCDVKLCVNPRHLFLGDVHDNNNDMASKDRVSHGSHHWNAKLTERLVLEIRVRHAAGEQQQSIATSLHVSQSTISGIVNGKKWQRALRGEIA